MKNSWGFNRNSVSTSVELSFKSVVCQASWKMIQRKKRRGKGLEEKKSYFLSLDLIQITMFEVTVVAPDSEAKRKVQLYSFPAKKLVGCWWASYLHKGGAEYLNFVGFPFLNINFVRSLPELVLRELNISVVSVSHYKALSSWPDFFRPVGHFSKPQELGLSQQAVVK